MSEEDTQYENLYEYDPSLAATALFAGLFGISTLYHVWQLTTKKTWYFIPFVVGGLFETFGYALRAVSVNQAPNYSRPPYILQTILILLAPALYAASIYMVLARLVLTVDGERHSLIGRKKLTPIFVSGDVVAFLVQVLGGAILASADDPDARSRGQNIIIAGLFAQLVVFGIFIAVTIVFHRRIVRAPTERSQTANVPWLRYIYILYIASGLIMVRSVFRVIEYVQGSDGELMSNEVYFYVFDTALMFIMSCVFNVYHPSSIIAKKGAGHMELGHGADVNPERKQAGTPQTT